MVHLLAVALPTTHLPNAFPALSVNLIIAATMALTIVYAVVVGYAALVRESISIYVGLVLANAFGKPLYDYLKNTSLGGFHPSQQLIQLVLLILPIIILQFVHHKHGQAKHNTVITMVLAVLTSLLLISSVLIQLDPLTLARTTDQSALASWIYDFRLVWLATVPIAIVASSLLKPGRHHRG